MLARTLEVSVGGVFRRLAWSRILGVDEPGTYTPRGATEIRAPQPYEG